MNKINNKICLWTANKLNVGKQVKLGKIKKHKKDEQTKTLIKHKIANTW